MENLLLIVICCVLSFMISVFVTYVGFNMAATEILKINDELSDKYVKDLQNKMTEILTEAGILK